MYDLHGSLSGTGLLITNLSIILRKTNEHSHKTQKTLHLEGSIEFHLVARHAITSTGNIIVKKRSVMHHLGVLFTCGYMNEFLNVRITHHDVIPCECQLQWPIHEILVRSSPQSIHNCKACFHLNRKVPKVSTASHCNNDAMISEKFALCQWKQP